MECGGLMYWKKILSPCDVCFTSDHNLFLNAEAAFAFLKKKMKKVLFLHQVFNLQYDKRLFSTRKLQGQNMLCT